MTRLVDAATVAERLGFSRDYVYAHADELGAIRVGSGPRPRLRFDLPQTLALVSPSSTPSPLPTTSRRPRSPQARADLLPIKGETTHG